MHRGSLCLRARALRSPASLLFLMYEPVYVGEAKGRGREGERENCRETCTQARYPNLNLLSLSRPLLFIYSISSFVYSTARPLLNPGFLLSFLFLSAVRHRRPFSSSIGRRRWRRAESNDLDTPAGKRTSHPLRFPLNPPPPSLGSSQWD